MDAHDLQSKAKEQARKAREAAEKQAKKASEQAKKVAGKVKEEARICACLCCTPARGVSRVYACMRVSIEYTWAGLVATTNHKLCVH